MFCSKCGEKIPEDAAFCPFCAADLRPAAAPPAPPAPAAPAAIAPAPAPAPAPVYAAPVSTPPPAAPAAKPSGCGAAVGIVVALLLVLVILVGVGGHIVLKRLQPDTTGKTMASTATTPAASEAASKTDGTTAPAETTTPSGSDQQPSAAPPTDESNLLSKYAGKWEFVGEPSPWGEGFDMELKVADGKLVGTSGMEGFVVKIELAERNGTFEGESTDSDNGTIPLLLEPTDNPGVMTLRYRIQTGEWLTRVIKRQGSNADWVG